MSVTLQPLIEELIHAEPSNIEVWYWRGVCERFDGELDLAENDFLSVIRQNPHHDRAFFGLGDILENKGNHKDAVAAYQQAASLGNKEAAKKLARYGSPPIAKQPTVSPRSQSQQPLQETTEHSAKPEIELKTERGIDYTRLRDLLASGKWKQADQETTRIIRKIMHHNDISPRDIANLPCLDLRSIDELWTRYSQGRFGLSAQIKIYQGVGGLVSSEGFDPHTFDSFVKRVGWYTTKLVGNIPFRKQLSALLGSTQLSYSLSALPGHLPGAWILPIRNTLYPGSTMSYAKPIITGILVNCIIFGLIGAWLANGSGLVLGIVIAIAPSFTFLGKLSEERKTIEMQRKLMEIFSRVQSCRV